jgi:hypothetical protein
MDGERPVLILAPKPLVWQWLDELRSLLGAPCAVWTAGGWVDENEVLHPARVVEDVRRCPRRIGIVSTGLITRGGEVADELAHMRWECVVLDEAHRARRRNLARGREFESAEPNNLLAFMQKTSARTHSLLLGTATPVQLHPIEAWDLLEALGLGSASVLGAPGSHWRRPREAIGTLLGERALPADPRGMWDWVRNPLPPAREGPLYAILRRRLNVGDADAVVPAARFDDLRAPERQRLKSSFPEFLERGNPFIRHIVLRRRKFLEDTLDPETGEPFLQPVGVNLHGESEADAIRMPLFFRDAYGMAEEFCCLLAQRARAGYFRTLLLRRFGSTVGAGRRTVENLLSNWRQINEDEVDEEDLSALGQLTAGERDVLDRLLATLEANREPDPKYAVLYDLLVRQGWLDYGCLVFTQYYDSADWLLEQLTRSLPEETIGLYAGAGRSQIALGGERRRCEREEIKRRIAADEIGLLVGTDAAAEGLNLQRLGSLVNLDLPWNPLPRPCRPHRLGDMRRSIGSRRDARFAKAILVIHWSCNGQANFKYRRCAGVYHRSEWESFLHFCRP